MLNDRLKSFLYAWNGILAMFRAEPNAKIHLLAAIVAIGAGFWFDIERSEWCAVVLAIFCVFAAEAFNTSIEELTNLVSPEPHPLAGKAKDLAAAGVLFTAIGAFIVGFIIFLPRILSLYGQ
ncbi:MAG: diacylglycerol kinase [Saprospiraceae bacterium]